MVYWLCSLGVAWLVPREMLPFRRRFCVHHSTMHQVTVSLHSKPHRYGVCVFRMHVCLAVTCHLLFWQNDRDLLRVTAVTRGGTDTKIRVSTENWPWRRKFSRRSCRDSNPGPFDHESDALTTELSPLPKWRQSVRAHSLRLIYLP